MLPDKIKEKISETGTDFNENKLESIPILKAFKALKLRWSIEVFFKEAKQLLNPGGCQSNDFDAQIADTTVSMIAFILRSFR